MQIELERSDVIYLFITGLFYLIFAAGIWLTYSNRLKCSIGRIRMRNRLKARKRLLRPENRLEKHLRKVLSAALKKPIEPKNYLYFTFALFLIVLLSGLRNVSPVSALGMAVILSSTPYLMLRVRVETIRRKSSYEGEKLISEFLCQYRICGLNIYRTIEQVILTSEETKITGRQLFKLLLELRNTGDPKAIKEATERFAYGINTNWSRMLANSIRVSAESGLNVSLALEDILIQLREARQIFEERKRLNSESARMVVFLAPVMYLGTILMTVRYLGIPFTKLLRNQFHTEQGFLLILLISFLFLINLTLIEIINNQRFDY